MTTTYIVRTLQPTPSMNLSSTQIKVATYAEAVEITRAAYAATGRTTYLSDEYGCRNWFRINANGETNHNNGAIYAKVQQ